MTRTDFLSFDNSIWTAYCTNDNMRTVEEALSNELPVINQCEHSGVKGIDFDYFKASIHERLFLIYYKTHQTNKMAYEFDQSMKHLTRVAHRWRSPPPNKISCKKYAEWLDRMDSRNTVRWKTNMLDAPKAPQ